MIKYIIFGIEIFAIILWLKFIPVNIWLKIIGVLAIIIFSQFVHTILKAR